MTKRNFMPSVILGSICLVVALLLSVVNMFTAPIIKAAQDTAIQESLAKVLPKGSSFSLVENLNGYKDIDEEITAVYKAGNDEGYVFQIKTNGFNSGLVIMCGIDSNGAITGTKVIASEETPDKSKPVFEAAEAEGDKGAYNGMTANNFSTNLIAGSTLTSEAYGDAVRMSLKAFNSITGGNADLRTPEEIRQDSCNTALGTSELLFSRALMNDYLSGVSSVYTSESGTVMKIGQSYVGIDQDGNVVGEVSESDRETALSAYAIYSAPGLYEITIPDGAHEYVRKISKTAAGSYVIEMNGYGCDKINYVLNESLKVDYNWAQDQFIEFTVSISADGAIIDVITTKHAESPNYGDKCATEEYYITWIGVTDDGFTVIEDTDANDTADKTTEEYPGLIAGSTMTTHGYQEAMKLAFDAFYLLEGGNE